MELKRETTDDRTNSWFVEIPLRWPRRTLTVFRYSSVSGTTLSEYESKNLFQNTSRKRLKLALIKETVLHPRHANMECVSLETGVVK